MARRIVLGSAMALLAALVLSSCDTGAGRGEEAVLVHTPDLAGLADRVWVADGIVDPDRQLVQGSTITVTFTEDSLSANAGCNTLRGGASIDGDELVVSQLASTMKACEEPLMAQDQWLSTFLTSRPTIEQREDDLWLSRDDTVIHLVAADD